MVGATGIEPVTPAVSKNISIWKLAEICGKGTVLQAVFGTVSIQAR